MTTNRLACTFIRTAFFGFACLFVGQTNSEFIGAATLVQQNQFGETPDPYFPGDAKSNFDPSAKPIVTPIVDQSPQTPPQIWNAPQTTLPPAKTPPKATVTWVAPLTDVNKASRSRKLSGSGEPNSFPPLKMPIDKSAKPRIDLPDTPSIIRERNTGSNDFDPNSFGSSSQPTPLAKAPEADSGTDGNSFAITPQQQNKTEPPTNNLFSKESFPQSKNSELGGSGSFGSKDSNDMAPEKQSDTKVAQTPRSKQGTEKNAIESDSIASTSFEPGKVLAIVGGEPIFVGDLLFDINQMIERFMPGAPEDVKAREREKMIPQILPKFVESKILFLGSLEMLPDGADVESVLEQASKEFDDKALEKMIKGSGLKSSAEFDANLRAMGSSLRQLRRSWGQEQLTKYFLSQQLNVKTDVTHQEMLDSYHENIESYEIPAKCRWEQVVIRFDRSSSRTAAKDAIVELGNQIVYGANLAAVAKKSSHGFLASDGGQYDWTTKGALVLKEIDAAIFSLPVGELSDIIETNDGYHVVRVIERTEATRKPFLEAQVDIKKRIETDKRNDAFKKHVEKLKREIPVEYFLNDDAEKTLNAKRPDTLTR